MLSEPRSCLRRLASLTARAASQSSPYGSTPRVPWDWEAHRDSTAWGGIKVRFPRTTRRITMLLATSALLLGIPAPATAYAASATSGTGWIRLAHLSPNTPPADVYLSSFANYNAHIVLHHLPSG